MIRSRADLETSLHLIKSIKDDDLRARALNELKAQLPPELRKSVSLSQRQQREEDDEQEDRLAKYQSQLDDETVEGRKGTVSVNKDQEDTDEDQPNPFDQQHTDHIERLKKVHEKGRDESSKYYQKNKENLSFDDRRNLINKMIHHEKHLNDLDNDGAGLYEPEAPADDGKKANKGKGY